MEFIFTECAGEEGEIRTRLQSGPYGSFSMFHYLCNQAFGMQHDFKVEFVKNHVPVETGGGVGHAGED